MKKPQNTIEQNKNLKKNNNLLLQDSIEKINKNWNDFTVSISGDFSFEKINLFCKRLVNPEFEMF